MQLIYLLRKKSSMPENLSLLFKILLINLNYKLVIMQDKNRPEENCQKI